MLTEVHKTAIREFFAALDRTQSMDPLDALAGPSYVAYFPGAPPMDREAMKAYGNAFFAACPGLRHSVDELICEGDTAAARLTISGRHSRPFWTPSGSIRPEGRPFEIPVLNFYRFDDEKVAEHRSVFDMLNFLRQIGAMPGA